MVQLKYIPKGEGKIHMNSIKAKLNTFIILLVTVIVVGSSTLAILIASKALENTAVKTMEAMVKQGANVVESRVHQNIAVLETLASSEFLTDETLSTDVKLGKLSGAVEKNDYLKIGISDLNGNISFSNNTNSEISDREYFQKAIKGEANVSDPLMSKSEGIIVVIYAAPILKNGEVIGILAAIADGNSISSIVDDISFGETGKAFMINKEGTKIAHYDKELVVNQDNDLENVKTNPELKELVELETNMTKGKAGAGFYQYRGEAKILAYNPVIKTDWSLAVTVNKSEVLSALSELIKNSIILAIIFIIISIAIAYLFAGSISNRIKLAITYMKPMAEGDFTNQIEEKHKKAKDEIGQMIRALETMQISMKGMLQLVINNSTRIDEDAQSLSAVSQQLSASSNVMATSIQEVTKGTVAQSESISGIAEGMNVFAANIDRITTDIKTVDNYTRDIIQKSEKSRSKMQNLAESVKTTNASFQNFENDIVNLSHNINKINDITNLINEISEQTNLLSLNAAIEAARAGESGKGFAVVAEEIRKLAEQSKQSSVNISALINEIQNDSTGMIQAVNNVSKEFSEQTVVVSSTLDSFTSIVNSVEEIIPKIEMISVSTGKINTEKNEIIGKIEDISAISEETSASSEEISASTEEIAGSSEDVANSAGSLGARTKEMMIEVGKFKL